MVENLVHLKLNYSDAINLDSLGALRRVTRLKLHGKIPVLPSHFPPNLSHLSLVWSHLEEDPMPLLQNMLKLVYLKLDDVYAGAEIVILHNGFPALKVVILHCLRKLENIQVEEGAMPELSRLEINGCSCLERLPEEMMRGMGNLEELKIVASTKIASMIRGADSHIISNVPYVQLIDDPRL